MRSRGGNVVSIGIVDIFIVLFLGMGAVIGFKHGAIREGTSFIGLFIIILVSFLLKDRLMVMLYENLPFFDFFGAIKGISAINVLFYQFVSFVVIFVALMFLLKVLIVVTGFVELLLKMTVFLSLPSKILGIFVGILEYYVYIFIILYILNMPVFHLSFVNHSELGGMVLEKTPVLSGLVDRTVSVYSTVWEIIQNKEDKSNAEVNTLVMATMLDHQLITVSSAKKLVDTNKVLISDPNLLDEYQDTGDLYDQLKERYYGNELSR